MEVVKPESVKPLEQVKTAEPKIGQSPATLNAAFKPIERSSRGGAVKVELVQNKSAIYLSRDVMAELSSYQKCSGVIIQFDSEGMLKIVPIAKMN